MRRKWHLILCFVWWGLGGLALRPEPSETFAHYAILDRENGMVLIYWNLNDTHITIEMFGKTTGWVGFGISPNGGMMKADMFVGWCKNEKCTITDRHGVDRNAFPLKNERQDVTLLSGGEKDGWTQIKFRRPLAGCEPNYDITITTSTAKIIWAWGASDPENDDISNSNYHGPINRGGRSLLLLESPGIVSIQEVKHLGMVDFFNNATAVPPLETYYSCTLFRFPNPGFKHHVTRIEPIIEAGNERIVHHMLLYQCVGDPTDPQAVGQSHQCYSSNMPPDFKKCSSVVHGWAIGGGTFYFPDHVGFPIGAEDSPRYVVLETHYDNPSLKTGIIDNSGFRLFYTDQLRQYDGGILEVGHIVNPFAHLIPPNAADYRTYGECPADCLKAGMDFVGVKGIKFFGAVLHTHLLGNAVIVHHISENGTTEFPHIARDEAYDYNYQEAKIFSREIPLTAGESIQVECRFDSRGKIAMTLGGLATSQEMCLAFLYYYPKIPVTNCETSPVLNQLYSFFGVDHFRYDAKGHPNSRTLNNIIIESPEHLADQTLDSVIGKITWNRILVKKLNELSRVALRRHRCKSTVTLNETLPSFGAPPNVTYLYQRPSHKCAGVTTSNASKHSIATTKLLGVTLVITMIAGHVFF